MNELFFPRPRFSSLLPSPLGFLAQLVLCVMLRDETFYRFYALQCANYRDPLTVCNIHIYTNHTYTHTHLHTYTYTLCVSLTDNHHLYVLSLLPSGFWFPPLIKTDFCRIPPPPPPYNPAEILFLFRRLKYDCYVERVWWCDTAVDTREVIILITVSTWENFISCV